MSASTGDSHGGESGISPEERTQLLSQIERLFTERPPIEITEDNKTPSGAMLPLFVNVVAIVLLVGAVFATGRIAHNALEHSGSGNANYLATEGLVVKRVKQQAAEKVNATEARIAAIKKELALLKSGAGAIGSGAVSSTTNSAKEKQLQAELNALQSSTNNRLAVLQAQQQQQLFFIRQLQSIYQNIGSDVSNGSVAQALTGVDSADKLLRDKAVGAQGELARVAPALMAGDSVLRAALLYGQNAEQAMKAASASDSKAKIAAIAELVRKGDERYTAGDLTQAQADYTKAIDTLADVSKAYTRLTEMSATASAAQVDQLTAQIAQLQKHVAELQTTVDSQAATIVQQRSTIGNQRTAIAADKRRAARQEALLASQLRQIEAQKVALQKRSSELATVVNSTLTAIQSASQSTASSNVAGNGSVVDLLRTKVEIRKLAESDAARKTYPDLYKQLDPFFQGYAQTYSDQGRSAALKQVASALNNVVLALNLHISVGVPNSSGPTGRLETNTASQQLSFADPIPSYLAKVNQALDRIATMN